MFKKKLTYVTMLLLLSLTLGACGDDNGSSLRSSLSSTVQNFLSGNVTGEVGKAYSTQWFNFAIRSIERVDEYAGYVPAEGNILLDAVVEELCTFNEPIPMGTFDFFVDADTFLDYVYPLSPLDETMMPENFDLAPKENAIYHMIYEIPANTVDLRLMYIEIDEEENEGTTFTINIAN
jgi:hypothetical protein